MREAKCEVPENARVESRKNTADFLEKEENGESRGFT
jgi:hypothetical protein